MSVNDECIENVVVSYQFHAFDAHDNDQYFFKTENTDSVKKLNDFFRNHCDVDMKFIYRKNSATYVKIKHEDINFPCCPSANQNLCWKEVDDSKRPHTEALQRANDGFSKNGSQ